jgi:hypothetical protein
LSVARNPGKITAGVIIPHQLTAWN